MSQRVETGEIKKDCNITGELEERWEHSPDYHLLKLNAYVPVFVYGTMKHGEKNHKMVKDCPYLGIGETVTPCFQMRSYAGMFPILKSEVRKDQQQYCEYVLGEVYAVPPARLLHIDKLEDNGYMFQREMKHIWLPDQSFKGAKGMVKPSIKCWIYLATEFFENLEELPIVSTVKHNNRRYFNWVETQEIDKMWNDASQLDLDSILDAPLRDGRVPF